MMMRPLLLELFEPEPAAEDSASISADENTRQVQAAYEKGYANGWQDCDIQAADTRRSAEKAAMDTLQAIRFTYAEALHAAEGACMDLLAQIMDKVLGPLVTEAAIAICLRDVRALLRANPPDLHILCAPALVDTLSALMPKQGAEAIRVLPEESYCPAQITLQIGPQTRQIDPAEVLAKLRTSLGATDQTEPTRIRPTEPHPPTLPEAIHG
jgi:hypothetical protein